jgi:hypothetical protein
MSRSPAPMGRTSSAFAAMKQRLRWVSMTPFGVPVVPEV